MNTKGFRMIDIHGPAQYAWTPVKREDAFLPTVLADEIYSGRRKVWGVTHNKTGYRVVHGLDKRTAGYVASYLTCAEEPLEFDEACCQAIKDGNWDKFPKEQEFLLCLIQHLSRNTSFGEAIIEAENKVFN